MLPLRGTDARGSHKMWVATMAPAGEASQMSRPKEIGVEPWFGVPVVSRTDRKSVVCRQQGESHVPGAGVSMSSLRDLVCRRSSVLERCFPYGEQTRAALTRCG